MERNGFNILAETTRGPLLLPGDSGYDEARMVWNGRFDNRPSAIQRCSGVADVIASVSFAREEGLNLCVKGGGHSFAGKSACDGGFMLDLSLMKGIWLDRRNKTAHVRSGETWGAFDHEAQAFGLATPGGTASSVGVAGLTLGGGSGYLTRKYGLTIDNLVSADVVTADGVLVTASDSENQDLFWGLRGGGGNLGIASSFKFRLHEVGPIVLAGQVIYPLDQAADVMRFYREFMAAASDDIQCYAFFLRLPPLPGIAERYHGSVVLDLVVCYAGETDQGAAELAPLRNFGRPILDVVQPVPFTLLQKSFDAGLPKGGRYYSKATYLNELSNETIGSVLSRIESLKGTYTVVYFETEGGAAARVDAGATAFAHRDATHGFHIIAGWDDPSQDDEVMEWADGLYRSIGPLPDAGVYVNLLNENEDDRIRSAYGANYDKLVELKRQWDPENLFRANQNVLP